MIGIIIAIIVLAVCVFVADANHSIRVSRLEKRLEKRFEQEAEARKAAAAATVLTSRQIANQVADWVEGTIRNRGGK